MLHHLGDGSYSFNIRLSREGRTCHSSHNVHRLDTVADGGAVVHVYLIGTIFDLMWRAVLSTMFQPYLYRKMQQ